MGFWKRRPGRGKQLFCVFKLPSRKNSDFTEHFEEIFGLVHAWFLQTAIPSGDCGGGGACAWIVKPANLQTAEPVDSDGVSNKTEGGSIVTGAGYPVQCGAVVQFQHAASQAFLRASSAKAPLSQNFEVKRLTFAPTALERFSLFSRE